jgi:hypothetical protein
VSKHESLKIDPAADKPESKAILRAFRFLEDVTEQVQALRKTLRAQVISGAGNKQLSFRIADKFKEDYETSKEDGWLYGSHIDTFEIFKARGKKPAIFAAFQISLAPHQKNADETFFPHVAILLAEAGGPGEWEQWECNEFQLDYEYMAEPDPDTGDSWVKSDGVSRRWQSACNENAVAFVVPLVELCDEKDTKKLVIAPLFKEIEAMLKRIDGA